MKGLHPRFVLLFLAFAIVVTGCQSMLPERPPSRPTAIGRRPYAMKPLVAVVEFENRAGFQGKWKLGNGMADILTTELLKRDRVVVIERQNLDDIVSEIIRQGKELFRQEGRVARGRLKNAKYIIRGTITDFTVTRDATGWFGVPQAKVGARGSRSRVALTIRVSDVETGEIISSIQTSSKASTGWFGGEVNYKRVSFGGDTFFRTPLGRATQDAIRKAVRRILKDLPTEYWEPRVAEAGPDQVIINGGRNVRLKEGATFTVRGEGREITDPITGNVIEELPGRAVGKIQITEVKSASAHAVLLEGTARRGYFLEPIVP